MSKSLSTLKCFMCDRLSTTKDHVPPRCFFPSQQISGVDFRRNLIKVPSCAKHNNFESDNDQYTAMTVAYQYQNNHVAEFLIENFQRAIHRRPSLKELLSKDWGVTFKNEEMLIISSVDMERIEKSLRKIALGLYYHEFQQRWEGTTIVIPFAFDLVFTDRLQTQLSKMFVALKTQASVFFNNSVVVGGNPSVFFYQIANPNIYQSDLLMKLVFYQGTEFLIVFTKTPYSELMQNYLRNPL